MVLQLINTKKLQNYLEFWRFFIPNFKNENNRVIIKGDIK